MIPETFYTVHEQLVLFGLSCLFGGALGVCYDVFRALRVLMPHNTWLVVFEDVLFMAGYSVFLMAFTSGAARGELRFYFVIGNLLGFIIYFFTVGNAVISALKKLLHVLGRAFCVVIRPLTAVYVFIREKAVRKFVGSSKVLVKSIKNVKMPLIKSSHLLYNKKKTKKKEREERCRKS